MARLLVLWFPDWPVVAASLAAGVSLDTPAAVLRANRVLACSGTARRQGVRRGLRRREAQARCPELVIAEHEPDRDARLFEPVAAEIEHLAPGIELVRPGLVAVPVRGPGAAFGGEARAAERLVEHLAAELGMECLAGVADGLFAAVIAAIHGKIVPDGAAAAFLAPLPISTLTTPVHPIPRELERSREQLVDLLVRVGIREVGAFAALSERDVHTRFGADAVGLHRLARGREQRPVVRRAIAPELDVQRCFDPPLARLDTVAFAASELANRLHGVLARAGVGCPRLMVRAETANGESFTRVWRCVEPLTEHGIAERVRWQMEGWLRHRDDAPSAGITRVLLEPAETVAGTEGQLRLGETATDRGSAGALNRVQGLLGPERVFTPVLRGGRTPAERVLLVPWGQPREPDTDPTLPWPGQLPAPAPATLPDPPLEVTVLDEHEREVGIGARCELSAPPRALLLDERRWHVREWAGPWMFDLRWWTSEPDRAIARLQLSCAHQRPEKTTGQPDRTSRKHPKPAGVRKTMRRAGDAGDASRRVLARAGKTGTSNLDEDAAADPQQAFLVCRKGRRWFLEGIYD